MIPRKHSGRPPPPPPPSEPVCSFCGKTPSPTRRIIEGVDLAAGGGDVFAQARRARVGICSECIELCHDVLAADGPRSRRGGKKRRTKRPSYRRIRVQKR